MSLHQTVPFWKKSLQLVDYTGVMYNELKTKKIFLVFKLVLSLLRHYEVYQVVHFKLHGGGLKSICTVTRTKQKIYFVQ